MSAAELGAQEARILGALIEKHMTTPDHYPLTTSSLRAACNQSSNRDPVVSYDEDTVIDAVNGLREKDLARTVRRSGERAIKHLETADEGLDINRRQKALLAVLLLRGPQTAGELRMRTERYCDFVDVADVEATLGEMERADNPTVRLLARRPGQKEPRYTDLIADRGTEHTDDPKGDRDGPASDVGPPEPSLRTEIASLKEDVEDLRREVADLKSLIED